MVGVFHTLTGDDTVRAGAKKGRRDVSLHEEECNNIGMFRKSKEPLMSSLELVL